MELEDQRRPKAEETEYDSDATKWLHMLEDAERPEKRWHEVCDNIDQRLAELEHLAGTKTDRELQIFWANMEVLKPAVYTRPPVPVVSPRFKQRESVARTASEALERALSSNADRDRLHDTLEMVRDDLLAAGRGVPWVRVGMRDGRPAVVCDHVERGDFRMEPARKWKEVSWVARRAFVYREEGIKRFGPDFANVQMEERKLGVDEGSGYHGYRQAEVWEIWHKAQQVVVWVSPGHERVLDIRPPHLDLEDFFPCPKPAMASVQRGTLIPVPDFVYYRDQVEEINTLTARISALAESLKMRGFYAAGAGEVAEAVEAALAQVEDRSVLVPVSNFAALGGAGLKDSIVWLPLTEIARTITDLVALRRQMIEDVYEVTGLSDIMRGATEASETLGAQQLKAQYGSIRVRNRQAEMQRIAKDVLNIQAEIMAEQVPAQELVEMAQMQDVPTQAEVEQAVQQIVLQAQQQGPEALQQAQAQIAEYREEVTVEQIGALLQDQRVRPFAIDIETDSTIAPDENAEKQRRVEYMTAVGGFLQQAVPIVAQVPELAPFAAESLRFVSGAFRAGRAMEDTIDALAEQLERRAQPQPDPMQQAAQQLAVEQQAAEVRRTNAQAAKDERAANPPAEPVSVDPLDRERAATDRIKAIAAAARDLGNMINDEERMDRERQTDG